MVLKIALLLSMIIQMGTAIIAVSMIRRTRFNASWILISFGFVFMTVQRVFEFSSYYWETRLFAAEEVNSWIGVTVSVLMLISLFYIRQIFNLQDQMDDLRKSSEKKVLSAIIQGEDRARQIIAGDLHDGIGPLLSSVKMTISATDTATMTVKNREAVERTCVAIDEAILSLREISNHLSPHLLKNFGLTKALDKFAAQLFSSSPVNFKLKTNIAHKRFSGDTEISLYRIVTELLNNSIKHSSADLILLEIVQTDNLLKVAYRDNGKGFDTTATEQQSTTSGMGIRNIFSRVKSLGGEIDFETAPGKGVIVTITTPVNEKN